MKIVIEVRGGVVQEVYSDMIPVNVTILDWDELVLTKMKPDLKPLEIIGGDLVSMPFSIFE